MGRFSPLPFVYASSAPEKRGVGLLAGSLSFKIGRKAERRNNPGVGRLGLFQKVLKSRVMPSDMDELRKVSDSELLKKTREMVSHEREIGIQILHHLSEIKRRKLHVALGFSSVFTYLVEELKYSNGDAYRKLQALTLLEELPELEEKLQSGALTLTHMSAVQNHCKGRERVEAVKMESEDKRVLLSQVEGKSSRETEKILAARVEESGHYTPPAEFERSVAGGRWVELKIAIPQELHQELKHIQALWSHALVDLSYAALLQKMADHVLNGIDPEKKEERRRRQLDRQEKKAISAPPLEVPSPPKTLPTLEVPRRSRTITPSVRRQVWLRDQGRCVFVAHKTGRKCGETQFLELDHRIPWALGGGNEVANLRLTCRVHNVSAAIDIFGTQHMASFVKAPK